MLDNKLDELLMKNEIRRIDSNYNIAVILTHHNSSQKHIEGLQKKVRMVLKLRLFNLLMKEKNRHSILVKAIEHLLMRLYGSEFYTAADIARAYRSVVASPRLQQMTAFRCPSSRKYPQETFAFRSACDGLANMPGFYSYGMQENLSPKSHQPTANHHSHPLA